MSEQKLSTVGEIVEIAEAGEGVECRIVPGYPAYAVGDDGSVWSYRRIGSRRSPKSYCKWKQITARPNPKYLCVGLRRCGKTKMRPVHQLVLEAFTGPRPLGYHARHLNGDMYDNRPENLAWGTIQENHDDKKRHGTNGFKLTAEIVVEIRSRVCNGEEYGDIAPDYDVTTALIGMIARGKIWGHAGGPILTTSRRRHGDRIHNAKVSAEDIPVIRTRFANGESRKSLANEYGIHTATIRDIVLGLCWKEAGGPISERTDLQLAAAKLSVENVRYIKRKLSEGVTGYRLAKQFGVRKHTIYDIRDGVTWKNVTY